MQLGNHLGNVLVTISDRKKGIADPLNAALIKFFEPVMLSGTDYYPFGMAMRVGGDNKYKYGFNGKENDNEVKGGDGLQQDYGMRVYDNRLGRFLSVDPLSTSYPWNSPYSYSEGDPINYVDIDGAEKGTSTAQATPRVATPELSNLSVNKSGDLVNSTQMFTSGRANAANYTFPSWLSKVDYNKYVPPYAQTASVVQNPHGVFVVGQTTNGTNYAVTVYQVPEKKEVTWVDRLVLGLRQEKIAQLSALDQNVTPAATTAKVETPLKSPSQANSKNEQENIVYRGLSEEDVKSVAAGKGIVARDPNANNSVISHVAGQIKSRWISTTKLEEIAKEKYGENGYVKIDLNKVSSEKVDLSNGIPEHKKGSRLSNYAKKDQEVLIEKTIPQEAIIKQTNR